MLRSRLIPSLLIQGKGLVKTTKFLNPRYIGDPINTIKIFNEKNVDEIFISDIDVTVKKKEPNYKLIENLAIESRMPFCYSGGVNTLEKALKIIELGVEKVAIGSAAVQNPQFIRDLSERIGAQSVVVILDIKKTFFTKNYEIFTHNGKKASGFHAKDFALKMESLGAGEIIINSIERDGCMQGYDLDLINEVSKNINIPFTVLGGAGNLSDIEIINSKHYPCGAAASSIFIFKGKHKAVLIQYPSLEEKEKILMP